jgi:Domain of unknown function (DUF222)
MSMRRPLDEHPLLRALSAVDDALDDVAELDPVFLPTGDKERALVAVERELSRLAGLKLELLAAADDVADDHAARSAGVWLAVETRAGARNASRDQRLADGMERWSAVRTALRAGSIRVAQAEAITRALDALPGDLEPELLTKACAQLLADAGQFGPRELQVLGRRVLEVIAPDLADALEERLLRMEEDRGRAELRLTFRPHGDGVTDVVARVPDQVADRVRVYRDAFVSPRRTLGTVPAGDVEALSLPRRRGEAFCAVLEHLPADGLPVHGGTATSVMVMIDLESLRSETGLAETAVGGALTAAEVRRLACDAGIIPVVLGGKGQPLDLGRTRRLFSPAQRKALVIRDRHCRAEDCQIPAAWCEAHHAVAPWTTGGRTDLEDGVLLCSFHHHRAHHLRWRSDRLPSGDVRFTRRR